MSILTLHHGSESIVDNPQTKLCKPNNDYGKGFYCTEDIELAKEWACQNDNDGYINTYTLPLNNLKIVNLNTLEYSILNWIEILFRNRLFKIASPVMTQGVAWLKSNYAVNIDDADLIIGYRADDSYFGYARAFLNNSITLEQLYRALLLGDLGMQVMIKSNKAFNALRFEHYEDVSALDYYEKYDTRDSKARGDYELLLQEKIEDINYQVYLSDLMTMSKVEIDAHIQQIVSS